MRIGIDVRCLEEEYTSGVGEYTLALIEHLLSIDNKNQYVIFSNAYRNVNKNFRFLDKYPGVKLKRFRFPNKLLNFFLWYINWPKLDKLIGDIDFFFAPNINFLTISKKSRLISTFHDLSFEHYPEFFDLKTRLWHYFFVNPRQIAKKSDLIIAVSESTKKDLEKVYKIPSEKIRVIHHGVSSDFKVIDRNNPKLFEIQKKYRLPCKFILYLGNIEPRKNVPSLVMAYIQFRKKNPELKKYKLVLSGNISSLLKKKIRNFLKRKFGEDIILTNYIDREDRSFVYNLASLFVYPSIFEGFGLPVLEAMACGTPVIASNNSSIPEVTENSVLLINPHRPEEIAEAIKNVLTDKKLYNTLKKWGLKQAQKFNWKKSAEKTLEIIESLEIKK